MAKLEMDPPYRHVRGRIGGLVYRRNGDGTAISKAQAADQIRPPTPAQLAVREQFRAAAAYAKATIADPVQGPLYAAAAAAAGQSPFAFAVADFLKAPVVHAIDLTGYHGDVGEVLKVRASDDFEVTGVTVELRDAADVLLEQGAAALVDGQWHYLATTEVAAGTALTIRAVATDRPGHTGMLQVPLIVA